MSHLIRFTLQSIKLGQGGRANHTSTSVDGSILQNQGPAVNAVMKFRCQILVFIKLFLGNAD